MNPAPATNQRTRLIQVTSEHGDLHLPGRLRFRAPHGATGTARHLSPTDIHLWTGHLMRPALEAYAGEESLSMRLSLSLVAAASGAKW